MATEAELQKADDALTNGINICIIAKQLGWSPEQALHATATAFSLILASLTADDDDPNKRADALIERLKSVTRGLREDPSLLMTQKAPDASEEE